MPVTHARAGELPSEVDIVVVGSSAAALTGALTAAQGGLSVLVLEKTEYVGGAAAYSGAGLWLPGNRVLARAGVEDTVDAGLTYFRATVGNRTPADLQEAYIATGPDLVEFLEEKADFRLDYMPFPDYFEAPGRAKPFGRAICPDPIDSSELGPLLDVLRPTAGDDKFDREVSRSTLTGGQSLIGQLLLAIERTDKVDIVLQCPMTSLTREDDVVTGVRAGGQEIRARHGVLLALGGYDADDQHRRDLHGLSHARYSATPIGANTGDALDALRSVGAAIDLLDEAWWCPAIVFANGLASFLPILKGGIIVGEDGKRFVDEGLPYDRLGHELLEKVHQHGPDTRFWWIFDARTGEAPGQCDPPLLLDEYPDDSEFLHRAPTIDALATEIGVDPEALRSTVARYNQGAEAGTDEDFGRGVDDFARFFADSDSANPALPPLTQPPYWAVRLVLSDLGSKGGAVTDVDARVLDTAGVPIRGLYAAGGSAASVAGHVYPGPGTPLGSGMTFAYRAMRSVLVSREAQQVGSAH